VRTGEPLTEAQVFARTAGQVGALPPNTQLVVDTDAGTARIEPLPEGTRVSGTVAGIAGPTPVTGTDGAPAAGGPELRETEAAQEEAAATPLQRTPAPTGPAGDPGTTAQAAQEPQQTGGQS
jgi:hypothetical protein